MRKLFTKSKGFSLVELLVVISIIGLLMGIIIPNLNSAKANGRDARRVSDIKNIQLALALYYNDNLHYPCSLTGTGNGGTLCGPDFTPAYMSTVPVDPKSGNPYLYSSQSYNIAYPGSSLNCNARTVSYYHLGAVMEAAGSTLLAGDEDKSVAQQTTGGINNICSQSPSGLFDGNAADCSGTSAAGTDNCYDVVPPS